MTSTKYDGKWFIVPSRPTMWSSAVGDADGRDMVEYPYLLEVTQSGVEDDYCAVSDQHGYGWDLTTILEEGGYEASSSQIRESYDVY